MVWVKQRGFPWWPCKISCDPDSPKTYYVTIPSGKSNIKPHRRWHVQFLGCDKVLRGAVSASMLRLYGGPTRDGDLRSGQQITKQWASFFPRALKEADDGLAEQPSPYDRLLHYLGHRREKNSRRPSNKSPQHTGKAKLSRAEYIDSPMHRALLQGPLVVHT